MNKNQTHWLIFVVFSVGVTIVMVGYSYVINAGQNLSYDVEKKVLEYTDTNNVMILMKTNFGDIKLELFKKDAPMTTLNFIKLAQSGFYDGTKFHRIIKNFMIQSGDPNSKDNDWSNDGMGGPGYTFKDEINRHKLTKGVLAMANAGPDTNGSQFFIVTAESTPWLDGKHTVFGKVTSGIDIVDKIENVATNNNDHPTKDIVVKSVTVLN